MSLNKVTVLPRNQSYLFFLPPFFFPPPFLLFFGRNGPNKFLCMVPLHQACIRTVAYVSSFSLSSLNRICSFSRRSSSTTLLYSWCFFACSCIFPRHTASLKQCIVNLSITATFGRSRYYFLRYNQPVYSGHLYKTDILIDLESLLTGSRFLVTKHNNIHLINQMFVCKRKYTYVISSLLFVCLLLQTKSFYSYKYLYYP